MKPMPKLLTRLVAACLTFTSVFPVHAAPLAFKQLPPEAVAPPPPNILVTLDDSGSMISTVPFVRSQEYPIPPGPDGLPIQVETSPPMAYGDGYSSASKVSVSGKAGYPAASDPEGRQRFVRWWGFYRTRNMAMKASVMSAFSPTVVPDDQFRLAWQGLTATCSNGFPASDACPRPNTMWTLSDSVGGRTHRTNFFNWVRSVPPDGSTPLRDAAQRAGQYFLRTGVNSPWAFKPGVEALPSRSCRRSYHLLFTDGQYNTDSGYGDNDNNTVTLPDGVVYNPRNPYRGPSSGGSNTLADIAFRYWATDLQTGAGFDNNLLEVSKKEGPEDYGSASVPEYWNPKNNPATWQHLTTYTIGFGEAAAITDPAWAGGTTEGPGFAKVVDGSAVWPSVGTSAGKRSNLWHAAVNSRGQFFPATDQAALTSAFKSILGDIVDDGAISGGALSSLSAVAASDFTIVEAGFTPSPTWRADIKGYGITAGGKTIGTAKWDAQEVVAAQPESSRVVLTSSGPLNGVPFRWGSLSGYQQTALNLAYTGFVDSLGSKRVPYLRGSKADEVALFRERDGWVIGTVANSEPRIVQSPRAGHITSSYRSFRDANISRSPIVYVGANDGMLHGIKTETGEAVLSYVPRGVYPKLPFYTDAAYTHTMYVDGPLISSDFQDEADSNNWKTILVGGLGAGGKGLFALDVTKPSNFSEANALSLVKFDYTAPTGPLSAAFTSEFGTSPMLAELQTDMGHIFGDPSRDSFIGRNLQITRMQNGKWAVISGNGYNSVNERAVLYVIYLDGTGFVKIPANPSEGVGTGNGLSIPFPADINGDGLTDTVYAGDLKGNMWKFDLKSSTPSDWALPASTKRMINTGRPITTAPTLLVHPQGGVLVSFGTGQLLTDADDSSTALESIYGIWDKPSGSFPVTDADLAIRKLQATDEDTNSEGGVTAKARVLVGGKATAVDYGAKRGWKVELLKSGERVIFNPIGDGTRVFFSTSTASADACVASDGGSFLAFDGIAGTEPASPILDINGNGTFGTGDQVDGRSTMGRSKGVGRLIGIASPPPPPATCPPGASCAPPCIDPANLAYGAQGQICVSEDGGTGRRMWRDLRP